eukprot:2122534-Rhodomonas_salina.1
MVLSNSAVPHRLYRESSGFELMSQGNGTQRAYGVRLSTAHSAGSDRSSTARALCDNVGGSSDEEAERAITWGGCSGGSSGSEER